MSESRESLEKELCTIEVEIENRKKGVPGESSSFENEKSASTAAEETKEEINNKSGDFSIIKSNGSDDGSVTHNGRESSLVRDSQSVSSTSSQHRQKKKRRTMTEDTRKVETTTASKFYEEQQRRKSTTERNNSTDDFSNMFKKDSPGGGSQDELGLSTICNNINSIKDSVMDEKEKPKSLFRMADNIVNLPREIHYHDSKGSQHDQHLSRMELLRASMENMPTPEDSITNYAPKEILPPVGAVNYFPSVPILDKPEQFEKLDLDTLFLIFYYQQGTYQQYLAARELKRHNWRFHKKYLTWFHPHEELRSVDNEKEIGTYIYFDYETGWCQRLKSEFCFEYCFLEDELNFLDIVKS